MKMPEHIQRIVEIAVPIAQLNDAAIASVIAVLVRGDGALIMPQVRAGSIAVVTAETSGRKMVIFHSDEDMWAFASKHKLKVTPVSEKLS